MIHRKVLNNSTKNDKGVVIVFFSLAVVALLGVSALAVDVGYVWQERIRLQAGADAAALAAVRFVRTSDANVQAEATLLASANGLQSLEYTTSCGYYQPASLTFDKCANICAVGDTSCCTSCADPRTNAVIVEATRIVPSILARIIGITSLSPKVFSVAMTLSDDSSNCIRPFALLGGNGGPLEDADVGDTITICGKDGGQSESAGNWGKITFDGVNMSSGTAFEDAMTNGLCNAAAIENAPADLETGFGGSISQVFDAIIDAKTNEQMVFAVVSSIPNGNTGGNGGNNGNGGGGNNDPDPIITGFVKVSFLSKTDQNGKNGNNWCINFRLDALGVNPADGGGTSSNLTQRYMSYVPHLM